MKKEVLRVVDLCAYRQAGCCLKHIYLNLYEGEVLGIVGLHDAGKTFLLDCIMGERSVTSGTLFFMEEKVGWNQLPRYRDIYRIRKKSSLVESRTVLENLMIIRPGRKNIVWISWNKIRKQAEICIEEFGVDINLDARVRDLTLEKRHEIEILKAYILGCRLILIDDLLALYRSGDYSGLYNLISRLQKKGVSFIMAGCQMDRMQMFTDRCLFMSDGWAVKTVDNIRRKQIDEKQLLFGGKISKNETDINFKSEFRCQSDADRVKHRILLAQVQYGTEEIKKYIVNQGEILVYLDIDHKEEIRLRTFLDKPKKVRGKIEIDKKLWKGGETICSTDFLKIQPLIESLSLQDNLCLPLYSRISKLGFISRKKTAVVERIFMEQYQEKEWGELNDAYMSFEKELAIFLERLKLQKWKLMFCFNLDNILTWQVESMVKKQLRQMTETRRSICIYASSLEKFKDFPDYYLITEKGGGIGRYTYQELKQYLGI